MTKAFSAVDRWLHIARQAKQLPFGPPNEYRWLPAHVAIKPEGRRDLAGPQRFLAAAKEPDHGQLLIAPGHALSTGAAITRSIWDVLNTNPDRRVPRRPGSTIHIPYLRVHWRPGLNLPLVRWR